MTTESRYRHSVAFQEAKLVKLHQLVFVLSILGGILLIISGTWGPIGTFLIILEKITVLTQDPVVLSVAAMVTLFLVILSSLGGFIVILGGYMIYKNHKGTGKMLMGLGAGVGIPWLLLILFTIIVTQDVTTVIAQHSIEGWVGIALSFTARSLAK